MKRSLSLLLILSLLCALLAGCAVRLSNSSKLDCIRLAR